MASQKRKFSAELKLKCVLDVISGQRTPAQVCRQEQISPSLLLRWRQQFNREAVTGFQPRASTTAQQRIEQLERLVGRLTLELDASKKVLSYFDSR
jgi:transposase-like protein